MKNSQINDFKITKENNQKKLAAKIQNQQEIFEIWLSTNNQNIEIASTADPLIPSLLFPAMKQGLDIWSEMPISAHILEAAQKVQLVKNTWDSSWKIIKLEGEKNSNQSLIKSSKNKVGVFFSGGVDSFYTLKKHREEITHLIFVHGFDIPLHKKVFKEIVSKKLRKIAEELKIELIEIETNLRLYSDKVVSWEDYHGAAMTAVAYFLAPNFQKIYFPSSYHYAFLFPYGSHPGLDPLWSIPGLELIHDGCETSRFDKIKDISTWNLALENLRVCWQIKEDKYNCCHCRKCLWTMAYLRTCNVLEQAKTFPENFDFQAFSQLKIDNLDHRYRILLAIAILEKKGDDRDLLEAMKKALKHTNYQNQGKKLLQQWGRKIINYIKN